MVEAVQFDLVRTFGGMPGLRDEHALGAVLARAPQRHAYEPKADVADLAAAYGFGLASSQPFIDGNKRIAFVTMAVFAELNGLALEAPEEEVVRVMLELASGSLAEADLAAWVRSRLRKVGASG
jgi:death-on-curing protein